MGSEELEERASSTAVDLRVVELGQQAECPCAPEELLHLLGQVGPWQRMEWVCSAVGRMWAVSGQRRCHAEAGLQRNTGLTGGRAGVWWPGQVEAILGCLGGCGHLSGLCFQEVVVWKK